MPEPTKPTSAKAPVAADTKRTLPAGTFTLEGVEAGHLDAAIKAAKERRPSDKLTFGTHVATRSTTGVHTFAGYKRIAEGPQAGGYDKTVALVIPEGGKPHDAIEVPAADLFDVAIVKDTETERLAKERQTADQK